MLRRDFVRAVVSVSIAPRLLLSQQTANPALPPPPALLKPSAGGNPTVKTLAKVVHAVSELTEMISKIWSGEESRWLILTPVYELFLDL